MSVNLEIQGKRVVRVMLVIATWVGFANFLGADSNGQVFVDRYPLDALTEEIESVPANQASSVVGTDRPKANEEVARAMPPNQAEEASTNLTPPSDLTSSLEATRSEFENQFKQAYAGVAGGLTAAKPSVGLDRGHATLPRHSAGSSQQQPIQHRQVAPPFRPQGVRQIGTVYPLVTPLPALERTSQTPAQQVGWESGGLLNDFPTKQVPSLGSSNNEGDHQSEPLTWWNELVPQPLHAENQVQTVDSNTLVYSALQNSPRIQGLSRSPLIRDFEVIEADAAFDPISFLRTEFSDRSDPIGGALDSTRDGRSTIENHRWTAEGGFRKRGRTGATYELSQRLGFENSNVSVFDPNNQGTAQLALNVTQPLGRGRGRYITQSQILIAQSRGGVAWETFSADLQQEIEAVVSAYWRLYYDRSLFLQKKRNVERGVEILETLEGRSKLDSLPSQITRARSSVLTRKTELANAFRDVRNSETELRRLIADRNWRANQFIELLPIEAPVNTPLEISLDHVVTTSLENRPEIRSSLQEAKLAGIERDISVNDLLPELSLLLGTYVSTLVGDGRFEEAFVDQFGETKPGYSVGLEFEMPVGNRIARSRLVQRKLQLARIKNQVDETIQNVVAESQAALRRLDSAAQTFEAAVEAIKAARSDIKQNILRWENFALVEGDFADGQTPTTVLDQLLDSQERLSSAEGVAAQSQLELKIAEVALQRAMGTLLIQRQINPHRAFESGTGSPELRF